MAKFKYRSTREMEPRPGAKFATTYYRQTPAEYRRVQAHVEAVIADIIDGAIATNQTDLLSAELKNFPRTGGKANYSAADILMDMRDQLLSGKDIASGILGRWNRLLAEFPAECIDMIEHEPETNNFRAVFAEPKY